MKRPYKEERKAENDPGVLCTLEPNTPEGFKVDNQRTGSQGAPHHEAPLLLM